MKNHEKYKYYLFELSELLKEMALDTKNEINSEKNNEYKEGYLMGFHRVITLMQELSYGFHISLKDLNLDDIDPNKDLFN